MTIRAHIFTAVLLATAVAAAAGCGGGKKGSTTPDEGGGGGGGEVGGGDGDGDGGDGAVPTGGDGDVVPPDTMDDIQRRFERKRASVSRCLSAAVDAKELPKNSRGRITLNITVMPGGKAGEIKVARTSLESPKLTECVIGKIREIVFPEVVKPFPTSYTYAFEAM
jgi:hypothetical protein